MKLPVPINSISYQVMTEVISTDFESKFVAVFLSKERFSNRAARCRQTPFTASQHEYWFNNHDANSFAQLTWNFIDNFHCSKPLLQNETLLNS
jgi:hypothetical protein